MSMMMKGNGRTREEEEEEMECRVGGGRRDRMKREREREMRSKRLTNKLSFYTPRHSRGYAYVDDFLSPDVVGKLVEETRPLQEFFEPGEIWVGKEAQAGAQVNGHGGCIKEDFMSRFIIIIIIVIVIIIVIISIIVIVIIRCHCHHRRHHRRRHHHYQQQQQQSSSSTSIMHHHRPPPHHHHHRRPHHHHDLVTSFVIIIIIIILNAIGRHDPRGGVRRCFRDGPDVKDLLTLINPIVAGGAGRCAGRQHSLDELSDHDLKQLHDAAQGNETGVFPARWVSALRFGCCCPGARTVLDGSGGGW